MSSATVERDSMSQKPIDTWKISAKSHSDAVPPSKGRHQAAAPRQNLISSLVASLPVGGSTVFTPANVSNTSWVVVDTGPEIAAGSVIGSRVPPSPFTIHCTAITFGPCLLYRLDQSREPNLTTGIAFCLLNCRIIAVFSASSETQAIPELELVGHEYLFMVTGSHK